MKGYSAICPICGKKSNGTISAAHLLQMAGEHCLLVAACLTTSAIAKHPGHYEGPALIGNAPEDQPHGHALAFMIDDTAHIVCPGCLQEAATGLDVAHMQKGEQT